MRRVSSVLLAGLAAMLLCVPALAAGSAQLVRTFVTGNTLYTYVVMDGVDQPVTQAEAKIGGQSFPASGKLELTLPRDSGFTVLLDTASGDFISDFETRNSGEEHVYGDGRCVIDVDSASGDVIVHKGKR